MFRCNKEIEISSSILKCDKDESAILNWLNILSNEFSVTPNEMICRLFFKTKHFLNDESIQKLYNFALNNTLQSNMIVKSNGNTKPTVTATRDLCKLPTDVLKNIGSYLTIKSRLRLSITNRMYYKMIQRREYFNTKMVIELCPKRLTAIYENNCGLDCCDEMSQPLDINIICPENKRINCQEDSQECILSKIIKKIEKQEEAQVYCILNWFKRALNKVSILSISKNWVCGLNHLPVAWIFDINSSTVNKNGVNSVDIRQSGSSLSSSALNAFATSYDSYWMKKYSQLNQLQDESTSGINYNVPVIGKDIRPIESISGKDRKIVSFGIARQFHSNYEKFRIKLPRDTLSLYENINFRLYTLAQFFAIFHSRLKQLRILFKQYQLQTSTDINIVSQIFNKNNSTKQLIKDLNTTETQLSFNDFLKKYDCQSYQLPQIKSIYFRWSQTTNGKNSVAVDNYDCLLLRELFENDKLMKLFNFSNTITTLGFSFFAQKGDSAKIFIDFESLKNSCYHLLKRLNNTKQIHFDFLIRNKENLDKSKREQFFNQFLSDMVVYILVNYDKIEAIGINFIIPHVPTRVDFSICKTVKIDSKQALSMSNRDDLINHVQLVTKQAYNHFEETNYDQYTNISECEINNHNVQYQYVIHIKRNFCL